MTDQPHPPVSAPTTDPGDAAPPVPVADHPYAVLPGYPAAAPWGPLAGWGSRVGAMLIDSLVSMVGVIPYGIGLVLIIVGAPDESASASTVAASADEANVGMVVTGAVLVILGFVLMLAIQVWNRAFMQGRTGQSIGKKVVGLKLVEERTGRPVGAGMAFVRDLAHTLDGFAYIGYLWPLWDAKRQTFADMIMSTVVVRVPKQP